MDERFEGGCHCGRVRFAVTPRELVALDCNCSVCTKKGFLHVIVEKDRFALLSDPSELTTYTFGTGVAKHTFCRTCGMHAFYTPRSHPDGVDVNLRCFDDDAARARFEVRPFDGKNWERAAPSIQGAR